MSEPVEDANTIKTEMGIGRRHIPEFAWPTVVLALVLLGCFVAASFMAGTGRVPLWAGMVVNTVVIYAMYTVVHEAVHGNVSSRRTDLRWTDRLLGVLCCFPLWLFFDHHRKSHMAHHARTNEEEDPDIYARGGFLGWVFVRAPLSLMNYFNPIQLYRESVRFGLTREEMRVAFLTFGINWATVAALVWAGYAYEFLMLWFIPWIIGQIVMLTLFTWVPHHDHHETGRYRNTRISLWPGANFLLLGQNYHLIHHMMPAIPYYRYKPTFEDLRPILESKGVKMDGFIPTVDR
ncbi:MAG: fatty acid desaturase [Notoacmeibacter sp.]|nr:fatty acid desaturase [Notoacmeibacter sp.]